MKSGENIEAYFIASQRYGTNDYLYKEMQKGLELSIKYPYKIYVTLVANGTSTS